MNKTQLMADIHRALCKAKLGLRKHSPEILIVSGIVGTIASTVMACKASTKVEGILDDTKQDLEVIHSRTITDKYTEHDMKKDITKTYAHAGTRFVKLYAPSVTLGALSIASILASNNIQRNRCSALAAAYTTASTGFAEYRKRVVDRFGENVDHELRYNIQQQEVTETIVDENGVVTETKTATKKAEGHSDFTRCFDTGCTGWTKDPELNLMFLRRQQDVANEKLKADGYLFLNDVYKMLGFPISKLGANVGWTYDKHHPFASNTVDFGIYDLRDDEKIRFVNGVERSIWLDFNPDKTIEEMV